MESKGGRQELKRSSKLGSNLRFKLREGGGDTMGSTPLREILKGWKKRKREPEEGGNRRKVKEVSGIITPI